MDFKDTILDAIGDTPLVRLNRLTDDSMATVLVKCEFMNPAGSIKDRMAYWILKRAEEEGQLGPGGMIIENTSGNTGMGAAMFAAARGYKAVFTMPDKMSREKIDGLKKAFGAEVIITATDVPGDSPEHYVAIAKRMAAETPGAFYMNQYHSQWNIEAHYNLTGPEIYLQTEGGKCDAVLAGTGTGGTISGIGRYFKEKGSKAKIIGVDPLGSVHYHVFHTGEISTPYVYQVEGLGEDIKCDAFDPSVVDRMMQVSDYECFHTARRLIREEGLFCGGSSGGIVYAAIDVARELGPGKTVIAVLPDSGSRYVTKYLSDAWMKDHGFFEPDRGLGAIEDIMQAEPHEVITAQTTDPVEKIVALMQAHGVSQIPLTTPEGHPVSIVHEIDVLRGLQRQIVSDASPASDIAEPISGMVHPKARVEELYPIFEKDQAAVVVDANRVVAVLGQIDLIDYLSKTNATAPSA